MRSKFPYMVTFIVLAALLYYISDGSEIQAARKQNEAVDAHLPMHTPRPSPEPIYQALPKPTPQPTIESKSKPTPQPTVESAPKPTPLPTIIESTPQPIRVVSETGEGDLINTSNSTMVQVALPEGRTLIMPPHADNTPVKLMTEAFKTNSSNAPFAHDNISRPVSDCPPTSQIEIDLNHWKVQTRTLDGQPKSIGGDDFFFQYEDSSLGQVTAVAFVTDHENGTYSLNFTSHPFLPSRMEAAGLSSLSATGHLVVWLEYTCGAGRIHRPFKDHWSTMAGILRQWTADQVPMPPIHTFVPPTHDPRIDLGQVRSLLAVGDSVMQQFVAPQYTKFYYKNLAFGKNNRDCFLSRSSADVTNMVRKRLNAFRTVHNISGVLLGMAAWELQKPFGNDHVPIPGQPYDDADLFSDHVMNLKKMIQELKTNYETVCRFFWKSGLYMHFHVVARDRGDNWVNISRLDYMSDFRTRYLYEEQKKVMEGFDIPVLELLDASFLMPDMHRNPGDAMHYSIEANKLMLSWFYPHGVNESMY